MLFKKTIDRGGEEEGCSAGVGQGKGGVHKAPEPKSAGTQHCHRRTSVTPRALSVVRKLLQEGRPSQKMKKRAYEFKERACKRESRKRESERKREREREREREKLASSN
jgi:hypothetical protein